MILRGGRGSGRVRKEILNEGLDFSFSAPDPDPVSDPIKTLELESTYNWSPIPNQPRPDGKGIWNRLRESIELILTFPGVGEYESESDRDYQCDYVPKSPKISFQVPRNSVFGSLPPKKQKEANHLVSSPDAAEDIRKFLKERHRRKLNYLTSTREADLFVKNWLRNLNKIKCQV